MKEKSEASSVILKGIRHLKLVVSKSVRRYYSDNAKEQKTKTLLKEHEIEAKGKKKTSAAPHISQQKLIVERRFANLFSAKRTVLAVS